MKHLIIFLLFSGICLAQGVRFGDSVPTQSTTTVPGVSSNVVIAVPGATINFCSAPANAVPCTNKATTFTDSTLTIACASSTQIVLAGTNSCVATTDTRGNWGVWVTSGAYEYTVTVNGVSSGPFPATPGGAGAGGVACALGAVAVPWFNGTLTLCDQNITDDGAGTWGVKTLNASTAINTPQISLNGNAGFLIGPFQEQVAPANPASGQEVCWGDSGTHQYSCKRSDGSNAMPTGGGGSLTVQTAGVNNTSQTTLNFLASPAFNGLTLTPSNPATGNEQFTFTGTLGNAGLTNSSTTVNGQNCALGGSCSVASGLLTSSGPQTAVTGTGAAATLYTYSLPGNTMTTTSCVRATAMWQHSTGAGNVSYIWNVGTSTFTSTANAAVGVGRAVMTVCNNGATNSQFIDAFEDGHMGTTNFTGPQASTAVLDSTVSQTISFQFNAASSEAVTPKSFIVENIH